MLLRQKPPEIQVQATVQPLREQGKTMPAPDLLALQILFAFVFLVAIYRAATQSITFDECLTYFWYKHELFGRMFRSAIPCELNVHFLYTVLARLSTSILGTSEFALRLPSLAGTFLYLAAVYQLCRLMFTRAPLRLLAGALLTLNPFLMDFMPLARGYMLALGLALTALLVIMRTLEPMAATRQYPRGRMELAAALLAVSVGANLSFIYLNLTLMGMTFALVALLTGNRRAMAHFALCGLFFILCAGATALVAPWWKLLEAEQGYGFHSLLESFLAQVNLTLNHARASMMAEEDCGPMLTNATALLAPLVLGFLALTFALVLRRASQARRAGAIRAEDARILLLLGMLGICLLGQIVSHALFNVFYPRGRTGLFLSVMLTLGLAATVQWHAAARHGVWIDLIVCPALGSLVLVFLLQFQTKYFVLYRGNADTRETMEAIREIYNHNPDRQLSLSVNWYWSKPFEYYRERFGLDRLHIVEIWTTPDIRKPFSDLYVFDQLYSNCPYRASLLHAYPISGTYLGADPGCLHPPNRS